MLERLQGSASNEPDQARPTREESQDVALHGLKGVEDSRLAFMALSPGILGDLGVGTWVWGSRPWQDRSTGYGQGLLESHGLTVGMHLGDEPLPPNFPPRPAED